MLFPDLCCNVCRTVDYGCLFGGGMLTLMNDGTIHMSGDLRLTAEACGRSVVV